MTRTFHPAASLLSVSALALTLSACKIDNRPLLARGEPAAYAAGTPELGPLDPGYEAVAYLPAEQAYEYPERAYAMSRAFYERPPSHAFAYEDEQPWVWEAADQGMMFAEPIDDGYRYYYYEPGETYPYYVQDPDYGYAYGEGGTLIALFTAAGLLLGADQYDDYYPQAHNYWTRAYDLNQTYGRAPRYRVEETVWRERAPQFISSYERQYRSFSSQPAWREAERHDNGRHLGWYKAPKDKDRGRRAAFAPQPDRREAFVQRTAAPEVRREAKRDDRPEMRREDRDDRGRQMARHEQPKAHDRREAHPQKARHEDRGGQPQWREARNVQAHAKPAASGGGERKDRGGGHGGDKGGGHGGDKGGGGHGGDKGGGRGGDKGGGGHGGGKDK